MNQTSQWSAEPTTNEIRNVTGQQTGEQIQPTSRDGTLDNAGAAGHQTERHVNRIHHMPMPNAEISSYQPQYQENRPRNVNVQETQRVDARSNQQMEAEDAPRVNQQNVTPQLEALQAQINALQAQLAQQNQQNQRGSPYQQPTTMDPLMVVGPWHHAEQQPIGTTQLTGQPQNSQGTTHHIQPTMMNTATGRGSLVLNTSIPPPAIQTQPNNELDNQTSLLRSVREITETMKQHIVLSGKQTEYNIGQNALLVKELIKSNDRRDLDHALAAIPMFMGSNKEECIEWLSRIKNVCNQMGRNFRQELVNKAGLTVQTFINSLSQWMGDQELTESIMQFFSNVPTVAHAVEELKKLQQGENEPIVSYNQKYKTLVERVEA